MKSALRLLFALLNSGLAAVFVLLSYRVLSEAFSADSPDRVYQWPLSMVVLSGMYMVVSAVLVASQAFAALGRGGGRVLVLCVVFLHAVLLL